MTAAAGRPMERNFLTALPTFIKGANEGTGKPAPGFSPLQGLSVPWAKRKAALSYALTVGYDIR